MRKISLVVLGCTLVLLVGYVGYMSYSNAKETRLMGMARQFVARSDARNAVLSLSEVLRMDPQNIEATRMMADLADSGQQANALLWRQRVVELAPRSSTDRIALASAALKAGDFSLATNSLSQVAPAYRKTAAYANAAGALAIAAHDPNLAATYFQEAARLDPQSLVPQLNYAVLNLHSTNSAAADEARTTLTKLANSSDGVFRSQALRELTMDAFVHGQLDAAQLLAQRLLAETNSQFTDQLIQLEILQRSGGTSFATALARCQTSAAQDPVRIFKLANWEMQNLSPGQTLNWLNGFPAAMQTNQPIALLSAECRVSLSDWRRLDDTLKPQSWGKLEFVRHAYEARACYGLQLPDGMMAEWGKAVQTAGTEINNLTTILGLAKQWNWPKQEEDVLWIIVRNHPEEKWAVQALTADLISGGRTESLMQLSNQQLGLDPSNLSAKNNLAMTALLLNANEKKPFELAQQVYAADPANISFASTYAFSLYLQHKNSEALKVFQQFNPQAFKDPEVAGYYGLILQATGQADRAAAYLKIAAQAQLLPEERALFAGAK